MYRLVFAELFEGPLTWLILCGEEKLLPITDK